MSKTNQLAVTTLPLYEARLTTDGIKARDALLESAAFVTAITTVEEQELSAKIAIELKAFSKSIEKTRKELKEPLLAAGRTLDDAAKDAVKNVDAEVERIETLLADYHKKLEAQRQAVIRAQQEAERKAREAREAAERAERERIAKIEADRLRAEQEAISARTKKAREAAAAEAKRLADEKLSAEFASEFTEPAQVPAPAPLPEVTRAAGTQTKRVVRWEVTDIEALYAAFPACVKLEASAQQINYLVNTPGVDITKIPGLHAWEDIDVAARASAAKPQKLSYQ